jgi:hypothetical protein
MAQQQNPQNQQNRNTNQKNQGQKWDQQRDDDFTRQTGGMNAGISSDDPVEGRDFDTDTDDELDNEDVQFGSDNDASSASNRNAGMRNDKPIGNEANSDDDRLESTGTKKGMNRQQSDRGSSSMKH